MRAGLLKILLFLLLPVFSSAQRILYTEPLAVDNRDMDFEIIGKVKSNILIFKNIRFKYAISVYDDSMKLIEKKPLDFIEGKTFNVDFITYPDFLYLIYQYQKKRVVYCKAVKLDAAGNMLDKPVTLDTTEIGFLGDNKIYSVINSENKQYISIFKIQNKNEKLNFATLLFDNQLQKISKDNYTLPYIERRDVYNNFSLDNEGNFVFTKSSTIGNTEVLANLQILVKPPIKDTLLWHKIQLNDLFLDEVKLKIDNANKRYLLNSFYYKQKRGNVVGLFSAIWDRPADSVVVNSYLPLDDTIRSLAKKDASVKAAFNNYFIKNIIVRKDGGYILIAEDYYTQTLNTNPWNRWDNLYSPYANYYRYYNYYDPFYRSFYSFNNTPNTKFIYNNIIAISFDKHSAMEWCRIISKEQFAEENDNYLSFINFNTGGQIHFLYNLVERKRQLLSDYSIAADGTTKRNPVFRTLDEGYEFMPQFSKQVSSRQLILPCTYRGNLICFAKVDY
ncbi:hypothetical protein LK994_02160 [Ferruginibacter lapsinanis]|uniref:hypothetical protein n=1 Tax=Ferruginibacter lapsinanis TaxID=563172 RepID=UPI001E40BFD4|nr:hypothetical protein [Ferruginibacter lapsinanis]UEG50277.1 hypothetical protein LK994_02160 [Ferruginibacter lapsinanis]